MGASRLVLLPLPAVVLSCSFAVRLFDAKTCEGEYPRCQGFALLTCEGGFEASLDCEPFVCDPAGRCGVCGNGTDEPGEICDDGNAIEGDGCDSNCTETACGNGVKSPDTGEECDDGNTADGDGCSAECEDEIPQTCGDGDVDTGEECEPPDTATCDFACQRIPFCGDGLVDSPEVCDDQNTSDADACVSCRAARCGDGLLRQDLDPGQPGFEECDDGGNISGDGCSATCQVESTGVCGDNQVEGGEECDDGNTTNGDGCSAFCQDEVCGDGAINNGNQEECDDGNTTGGDGCEANCSFTCGSGLPVTRAFDAASGHCYLGLAAPRPWAQARADCQALGGHLATIHNLSENALVRSLAASQLWLGLNDLPQEANINPALFVWEDGEPNDFTLFASGEPNNAGNTDCVLMAAGASPFWSDEKCTDSFPYACELETPDCGNGFLEAGEQCDDGPANADAPDACRTSCQAPRCGDGIVDSGEGCDDGNTVDGDGCSGLCQ